MCKWDDKQEETRKYLYLRVNQWTLCESSCACVREWIVHASGASLGVCMCVCQSYTRQDGRRKKTEDKTKTEKKKSKQRRHKRNYYKYVVQKIKIYIECKTVVKQFTILNVTIVWCCWLFDRRFRYYYYYIFRSFIRCLISFEKDRWHAYWMWFFLVILSTRNKIWKIIFKLRASKLTAFHEQFDWTEENPKENT